MLELVQTVADDLSKRHTVETHLMAELALEHKTRRLAEVHISELQQELEERQSDRSNAAMEATTLVNSAGTSVAALQSEVARYKEEVFIFPVTFVSFLIVGNHTGIVIKSPTDWKIGSRQGEEHDSE